MRDNFIFYLKLNQSRLSSFFTTLLIFIFSVSFNICSAQIWEFAFNSDLVASPSNGNPTISDVNTASHGYFTGINSTCSSTTGEPAQGAYSRNSFLQNSGWEFSFDASQMTGMSFSVCFRAASLGNTTEMTIRASNDGGTTWPVSTTVTGTGTSSSIFGGAITLSGMDNSSNIIIEAIRTSAGGATTIRIDRAVLSGTILPVKYLDFSATKASNQINLNWSTASEQNNDYFSIERSEDGLSFDAIGKVAGFGNSSAKVDYTFIDENPLNGTSYYRLKQVDFDGKVEYSSIISVKSENQKGDIDAKYLIGSQDLLISTPLSNYTITINDISGRVVRTFSGYSDDVTHISLSDLNQGLYIAVINGQFKSSKLRFKI